MVVSRKNYYNNSLGYIAYGASSRNNVFSTQISLELLANDPRGVEQYKTAHEAQYQMAVVGIFVLHLTGPSRQQVLEGPETMLDPVATLPCPDEPRPTDSGFETHYIELLLPGFTDYDECHGAIRWTGRLQPHTRYP